MTDLVEDLKPTDKQPALGEDGLAAWHRYANLFPMMDFNDEAFAKLVKDIQANGLKTPIVLYEDQVLDGRNRLVACSMVGVEPQYVEYIGKDPVQFVASQNLHRRHLTPSQRAFVGARMLELFEQEAEQRQREAGEQFGRGHPNEEKVEINLSQANDEPKERAPQSRDKAARASGSSPAAVQQAKKVQDSGVPELQAAVANGSIKVSEAAQIATLPPERQGEVITLPKRERQAVIKAEVEEKKAERIKIDTGISPQGSRTKYVVEYYHVISAHYVTAERELGQI